jgi:hypothetical protein
MERFKLNIYDNGILFILDIIRLTVNVFLILLVLKQFLYTKGIHFKNNPDGSIFDIINITLILEISIFVINTYIFITRMSYLNNKDLIAHYQVNTKNKYLEYRVVDEFKSIVTIYRNDTLLETILFFMLLIRLLLRFATKRVQNFIYLIRRIFNQIIKFSCLIFCINVIFSTFAKNLFGSYNDNFIDITSSFFNTLMMSIGHINIKYDKDETDMTWMLVYLTLFFVIIIYFFSFSFIGVSLEEYRVVSLIKGSKIRKQIK